MDMMQEFKSETSNYNAEFSKTGGVVLNLTSKSGTNEVHGSAFEFLQNRVLNARNFFQVPTSWSRPSPTSYRQWNPGYRRRRQV